MPRRFNHPQLTAVEMRVCVFGHGHVVLGGATKVDHPRAAIGIADAFAAVSRKSIEKGSNRFSATAEDEVDHCYSSKTNEENCHGEV